MPSDIVTANQDLILNPDQFTADINGQSYKIKPLNDVSFQILAQTLSQVIGVFGSLRDFIVQDETTGKAAIKDVSTLILQVPALLEILVPASTKILAQSIKSIDGSETINIDWISENVYAVDRVKLLKKVVEVNGLPSLLGEILSAVKTIPTPPTNPSVG